MFKWYDNNVYKLIVLMKQKKKIILYAALLSWNLNFLISTS